MKKIVLLSITLFCSSEISSQVSTPSNSGLSSHYVGWDNSNLFPLTIQHRGNQPIHFNINNTQRAILDRTTGFFGLGNSFSAPQNRLHLHENEGAGVYGQWTNGNTGPTWGDGFYVGIASDGAADLLQKEVLPMRFSTSDFERMRIDAAGRVGVGTQLPVSLFHVNENAGQAPVIRITSTNSGATNTDGLELRMLGTIAELNQRENDFLRFRTANNNNNLVERMRITNRTGFNGANVTGVSIGQTGGVAPVALLHLGRAAAGGFRNWMDIGTFTSAGTDHMYIGLKNEGGSNWSDRMDAIINWGDNQLGAGAAPDNLRIIFTSDQISNDIGNGIDGLEVMRFTPDPGANQIFAGIGGDPTANLYRNASQTPTATLEVNSFTGAVTDPGGASGLRFTDLTSLTPVINNPGLGVLAVDADGDVIYVPAGGGPVTTPVSADNG